ncbi:MAG: hypothetical protein J0M02_01320 [Planctomycetes bacterium]|nr:hypothetical protein [Planctomycetota bacterium]
MAATRRRPLHRNLSPELKAMIVAALGAVGDHLRLGPGYGMTPEIDLRWRLGDAILPKGRTRMPYRRALSRSLAEHLAKYLGRGYNESMVFEALRLRATYPRREAIPRFTTWTDLRPCVANREPSRRSPKPRARLRHPGLIELRRILRRAIAAWAPDWIELPCRHPAALLFKDGDITILVRIIPLKQRYMPMPELDGTAQTVLELRWNDRAVIRCMRKHRRHAQINLKDLRRHVLDP